MAWSVTQNHQLVGVERRLSETIKFLVLWIDIRKSQAGERLEPVSAHESIAKSTGEILTGFEVFQIHELLVVPPVLGGEYDVVDQHVVYMVYALTQGPVPVPTTLE